MQFIIDETKLPTDRNKMKKVTKSLIYFKTIYFVLYILYFSYRRKHLNWAHIYLHKESFKPNFIQKNSSTTKEHHHSCVIINFANLQITLF